MVTSGLSSVTGTRPNPVLSAKDMFANPAASSAVGTQTTPQTAQRSVTQAFQVQGGDYKVGPATPGLAVAGIFVVIALMFSLRLLLDGSHEMASRDKTRFHEVDVTLWNCLLIGVMAIPGIFAAKVLSVKFLHPNNPVRLVVQTI